MSNEQVMNNFKNGGNNEKSLNITCKIRKNDDNSITPDETSFQQE